jgi:RNA polymerase sigma factor (sigma-70 family)
MVFFVVQVAAARRTDPEIKGAQKGRGIRAAQRGDAAARDQLLEDFLPQIRRAARSYSFPGALDAEELVQEGVVGLFAALRRYDPELGIPFWAYASWWVRRMMQRLVADLTLPIVLSDRAFRQLACVKHARAGHEQAHHHAPSNDELGKLTGYSQDQLDSLTCAGLAARSLDERFQGEDDGAATLGDLLPDPHAEDGYATIERELEADDFRHTPNDLCERERTVLRARYGFDGPAQTLHEVGDDLHLSGERVRQIQQLALEKLQLAGSSVLCEVVEDYVRADATTARSGHVSESAGRAS